MSPAVAEELSLEGAAEGVVVASVGDGSTAAEVGVQKGDIVVAVNGQKIATTRDLEKACAERARLWDLTIQARRDRRSAPSSAGNAVRKPRPSALFPAIILRAPLFGAWSCSCRRQGRRNRSASSPRSTVLGRWSKSR